MQSPGEIPYASGQQGAARPVILIVDDQERDLVGLQKTMARRGFDLEVAGGPHEALDIARRRRPAVAVLDYGMWPINGVQLCVALKAMYDDLRVVFVTGDHSQDVMLECLAAGHDHLTKPYRTVELVARVEKELREYRERTLAAGRDGRHPDNLPEREAAPVRLAPRLTPIEARLFRELKEGEGELVSRDELIHRVWSRGAVKDGALDATLHRLRRKLELDPARPTIIQTSHNEGWFLDLDELMRIYGDQL